VKHVEEVVPAELRDTWVRRLLREVNPGAMTVLEWIRRPPTLWGLRRGLRHGSLWLPEAQR
jgi:hypothetical protein